MTTKLTPVNPHYPSKFKTGELDTEWRMVFDHMYAQQRHNADVQGRLDAMEAKHGKPLEEKAGGPSTTKIAGLNVVGLPPKDADRLTYEAKSGQIVWKP